MSEAQGYDAHASRAAHALGAAGRFPHLPRRHRPMRARLPPTCPSTARPSWGPGPCVPRRPCAWAGACVAFEARGAERVGSLGMPRIFDRVAIAAQAAAGIHLACPSPPRIIPAQCTR